jgi:hypothetical protein
MTHAQSQSTRAALQIQSFDGAPPSVSHHVANPPRAVAARPSITASVTEVLARVVHAVSIRLALISLFFVLR